MEKTFWPAVIDSNYLPRTGQVVVIGRGAPSENQYKIGVFQKAKPIEKVLDDIREMRRGNELDPDDLQYLVLMEDTKEPQWVLNSEIGGWSSKFLRDIPWEHN